MFSYCTANKTKAICDNPFDKGKIQAVLVGINHGINFHYIIILKNCFLHL